MSERRLLYYIGNSLRSFRYVNFILQITRKLPFSEKFWTLNKPNFWGGKLWFEKKNCIWKNMFTHTKKLTFVVFLREGRRHDAINYRSCKLVKQKKKWIWRLVHETSTTNNTLHDYIFIVVFKFHVVSLNTVTLSPKSLPIPISVYVIKHAC